jgi:molybdopterin synthase sulfur carrier subunit
MSLAAGIQGGEAALLGSRTGRAAPIHSMIFSEETARMAIEVRIPTILRTHTGGNKTVEGSGATLAALVDDLDSKHPGLKNRLVTEEGKLHRFVNVYVNDEDVRFTGALDTQVKDGDSVTILPAVAGG